LLEGFEEPLLIVRERRVAIANKAARAVLGPHIGGEDVRLALRHPAAAERLMRAGGEGQDQPVEIAGLGGEDRRWEMTTVNLPDGARLVRLSDRSAIHAAEKMRADFVANASHELRTPLATLLGFLETLQDETAAADRATRSRFVTIMWTEAKRMQRLVEDLLSLSRIEAERFRPPRDTVDLRSVAEEARSALGRLAEERGSAVVIEAEAAEMGVAGDRPQLLQLVSNLIENALKYGRAGAPVTVRIEDGGSETLRLSVADRGEGIPADHIPHLTQRFYRVDPGRSRAVGGTGLGLAIVKHIVGRHRGRLDIRSTPGEGTIVEVCLPRAGTSLS
jgi:two-component system phosphate regulon sensor histidine kinase PhoR